jgi:hypothetical protein
LKAFWRECFVNLDGLIVFTDVNIGTAVGRSGTILRTIDDGATWDSLSSGTTNDLWDVSFTDANTGTIVAGSGFGGDHNGEILRTTDGGATWVTQLAGYPSGFHGVSFTDIDTGTVVGNDGTIFRTTNGGITWIKDNSIHNDNNPCQFTLFQNYPNPFNPKTNIEYEIPKSASVELSVYNIQGQKLTTLVFGKNVKGMHRIVWNATDISSGIYI